MRIDVHAHYWTDDYLDLLVDLGKADAVAARGLGAGGGADLEARLRLMDRAGVDMQVLSARRQRRPRHPRPERRRPARHRIAPGPSGLITRPHNLITQVF